MKSVEGARRYYQDLGSPDRELTVYHGALHAPAGKLDMAPSVTRGGIST